MTSYYMEIMEGMIQNMGKAEIDKGKEEYALGMRGMVWSREKEF